MCFQSWSHLVGPRISGFLRSIRASVVHQHKVHTVTSRPMTPEEMRDFDHAFDKMDEAFRAMDAVFRKVK